MVRRGGDSGSGHRACRRCQLRRCAKTSTSYLKLGSAQWAAAAAAYEAPLVLAWQKHATFYNGTLDVFPKLAAVFHARWGKFLLGCP